MGMGIIGKIRLSTSIINSHEIGRDRIRIESLEHQVRDLRKIIFINPCLAKTDSLAALIAAVEDLHKIVADMSKRLDALEERNSNDETNPN